MLAVVASGEQVGEEEAETMGVVVERDGVRVYGVSREVVAVVGVMMTAVGAVVTRGETGAVGGGRGCGDECGGDGGSEGGGDVVGWRVDSRGADG